jgi:hypothetical protein
VSTEERPDWQIDLLHKYTPWRLRPITEAEYAAACELYRDSFRDSFFQSDLYDSRAVETAAITVGRYESYARGRDWLRYMLAPQRAAREARRLRNTSPVGAVCIDFNRDLYRATDGQIVTAEWLCQNRRAA